MIVSFYSYKGGVGRSQLCANTAAYLCYKKGKKVLLWDWDFEAPGLHHFFQKNNDDINSNGTIEIFEEYVRIMRSYSDVDEKQLPFPSTHNIISLSVGEMVDGDTGKIDLLPAGNYNDDFTYKVNNFNWYEFYTLLDGITYIEKLKEWFNKSDYDYILIDSRTGVNDYSGICNIQLPDCNVVVMAANQQNFQGSKRIINQILNSDYLREGHRKPYVFPILSRIDLGHPKLEFWLDNFMNDFSYLLPNIDSKIDNVFIKEVFKDFYLDETVLEYTPIYSAGENLLINSYKQSISRSSFISKYVNIAEYIISINDKKSIELFGQISKNVWQEYGNQAKKDNNKYKAAAAYANADDLDAAIELGGNFKAFFNKANSLLVQGDHDQAIQLYQQALKFIPDDTRALINLGSTYAGKGEYERALEYYKHVLEIDQNEKSALFNIGLECVGELRSTGSGVNFVSTKMQSDDQTVDAPDRLPVGRNFALFQPPAQAETRLTTNC